MQKNAKQIIEKNTARFSEHFDKTSADGGLHVIVGKIGLAAELDLITLEEMGVLVDRVFAEHAKVSKK